MVKLDLKELLLNIFKEDKIKNKENTIFSQLAIITIKSLMPNSEQVGNKIDYVRFKEELKLLKYYKIEKEEHILIDIKKERYFNYKDKTIYSRMLAIIVANRDYNVIEEEIIKNILYTTGAIETLWEWLSISKLIFMIIEQEENLLEELKQYIINISQIEFLEKYKDYFLYDYLEANVNFEIDFERTRVSLITLLHGIDLGKFESLSDIIGVLAGEPPKTSIGYVIEMTNGEKAIAYDIDKNYERMSSYVLKLRKSRIDPSNLIIKKYILPDIFKFEEEEVFFHSLLNHSKVIKKEVKNNSLTSLVETRAGMYLFKSDPFN